MFFCFLKQMKDVHLTHADFEDAISLFAISLWYLGKTQISLSVASGKHGSFEIDDVLQK